jgi:ribosomal protein S18 acetylase RimI-like enzyme
MTDAECDAYIKDAVVGYADAHIQNGMDPEIAREHSQKTYAELLPDGPQSKDQYIFTVKDDDETVGMLWFAERSQGNTRAAFVYDVRIDENHQRKGYGSQAFAIMEDKVRELGINSIRLHVFGYNHGAIAMYQKLGFETTNLQMEKKL